MKQQVEEEIAEIPVVLVVAEQEDKTETLAKTAEPAIAETLEIMAVEGMTETQAQTVVLETLDNPETKETAETLEIMAMPERVVQKVMQTLDLM